MSGSGATNGAPAQGQAKSLGGSRDDRKAVRPSNGDNRIGAGTDAPSLQFAQRARGATAGVTTSRGGQAVFARSAPTQAQGNKPSDGSRSAAPSARSATADLQTGFSSRERPSLFAAEASSVAQGQGIGAPLVAGLAMLGLGLTGIVGASLVLGLRRRRAAATVSDTTER